MDGEGRAVMIDLTNDGDDLDEGEVSLLNGFIDLTLDSSDENEAMVIDSDCDSDYRLIDGDEEEFVAQHQKRETRYGPVSYPHEMLSHWPHSKFDLRPGITVELHGKNGRDGDFIRIQDIILNTSKNEIAIRGQLLRRAKYVGGFVGTARVGGQTVGGKLKRDLNELALLFQVEKDDPLPPEEQSIVTRPLCDVLCVRRVIFTHEEFPLRSFREETVLDGNDPDYKLLRQSVKDSGKLCCRYAYTEYYEDERDRLSARKCTEASLRRLFLRDSDFRPPSGRLTTQHHDRQSKQFRAHGAVKKRKITYGSGCCGAGGDLQGAKWGGAHPKYGWDHDASACQSARQNHPLTKIYCREAEDFPREGEDDRCDILHLSWPCDYFSPNHTIEGKNDDDNIRAMFGTYEKLMSAKPRVHTQENTFGINSHHPEFLGTLIQEITRAGYNVRWKVDQFADYGSPASRKRLVLIASRIGIPLPEFPKASYGPPGSGLARYRTVYDAIHKIPANATWHRNYESLYRDPKPSYSPHTAKSSCITRDGGKHPHPSGLRPFTPREMANLQGFPESYEFKGSGVTEVKTQIGNAIPPNVWKHYIKSCVDTLEKYDSGLIDESGRQIGSGYRAETPKKSTPHGYRQSRKGSPMHSARTGSMSTPSSSMNLNARTSRAWSEFSLSPSPESVSKKETSFEKTRQRLKREAPSSPPCRPSPFKKKSQTETIVVDA